ncbi:YcaO-like family protein [Streptomyces sp. L2]|uniref:YcaO-like family protein n=1 Tax=Streptomyces sp. L2 TaxID=2162665 RepID=UPI001013792E|nr:YcaO-like family protein [Streptomyces sp. L2]
MKLRNSVPKVAGGGPHRERTTEDTWRTIQPYLRRIGVTRVADITGLDRIGIPVYNAIVPRSSDLISVYNGKGASHLDAKTSAVMEAVERFAAWQPRTPDVVGSVDDLSRDGIRMVRPDSVNIERFKHYRDHFPISWVMGTELISGDDIAVPQYLAGYYQSFHETPPFPICTTNGIASGNSVEEATCHALCELIERDDWTMAEVISNRLSRAVTKGTVAPGIPETVEQWFMERNKSIDQETLPAPHRRLIERYRAAGLSVELKSIMSRNGIPSFLCVVSEDLGSTFSRSHQGLGTHPDRDVAALRALSEAAQSRVVDIQAMREDISLPDEDVPKYMLHIKRSAAFNPQAWANYRTRRQTDFQSLPTYLSADVMEDTRRMIGNLRATGIEEVAVVDLSPKWLPVSVVRVVVPGIESWAIDRGRLGFRAAAVWQENLGLLRDALAEAANRQEALR